MTWHVIRVRSKDAQKQLARTSLRDYATIVMVIILVTMATPISSHVKDKNSMFTACVLSKSRTPGISEVFM